MTPLELARKQDEIDFNKIRYHIELVREDPLNEPTGKALDILIGMIYWAIERNQIKNRLGNIYKFDENFEMMSLPVINLVSVESLKRYLAERGVFPYFFFPPQSEVSVEDKNQTPDYLNPKHARYSPKLAAAVEAWLNVNETSGRSPKQSLVRWLRQNALRFSLLGPNGEPIKGSIEAIATVANWKPVGGAPSTLGGRSDDKAH